MQCGYARCSTNGHYGACDHTGEKRGHTAIIHQNLASLPLSMSTLEVGHCHATRMSLASHVNSITFHQILPNAFGTHLLYLDSLNSGVHCGVITVSRRRSPLHSRCVVVPVRVTVRVAVAVHTTSCSVGMRPNFSGLFLFYLMEQRSISSVPKIQIP
ncbi:hypothetical protein RJT34_08770 [Clitoria ternatea]|uniref:Uncharacterized protein n=1 Tax=Clitoria ternatea TaxID=43366 RepID=A0AAN9PVY9_CLITE